MVIIICTKKNYGYYYKVSRIQEKKIEGVSDRVYGSRFEEFPKEFWLFFCNIRSYNVFHNFYKFLKAV